MIVIWRPPPQSTRERRTDERIGVCVILILVLILILIIIIFIPSFSFLFLSSLPFSVRVSALIEEAFFFSQIRAYLPRPAHHPLSSLSSRFFPPSFHTHSLQPLTCNRAPQKETQSTLTILHPSTPFPLTVGFFF
ncbi:unnamed protein product [Tuber aestivum]|uniref:Uncharacterized protein n=1 Tax=Tuber aestivum TaxID=59557 RepID=A0A292PN75_9PEZI|nr:unnamed protein product [Tuber aestivum]